MIMPEQIRGMQMLRCTDGDRINTTEEAHQLAYLNFTVCDTNPNVIQERKECEHQRRLR